MRKLSEFTKDEAIYAWHICHKLWLRPSEIEEEIITYIANIASYIHNKKIPLSRSNC